MAVIVCCILLPVLYVLSVGPAYWGVNAGLLPRDNMYLAVFYTPLEWFCDYSEACSLNIFHSGELAASLNGFVFSEPSEC